MVTFGVKSGFAVDFLVHDWLLGSFLGRATRIESPAGGGRGRSVV